MCVDFKTQKISFLRLQLGAVGEEDVTADGNFGQKVIQGAAAYMDFYVIHPYAYWDMPANTAAGWAQALDQPRQYYGTTIATLRTALSQLSVRAVSHLTLFLLAVGQGGMAVLIAVGSMKAELDLLS